MSDGRVVVGIDCSTTGAKAVAYDADGEPVASGYRPLTMSTPAPGRFEQDADDWRDATWAALREVTAGVPSARIAAVGITCQRESFAVLDAHHRPLRSAILWLDTRAGEEVARHGTQDAHRLSGKPPSAVSSYYKLLWLRAHEPEVFAATRTVVDVAGWLTWGLTGRRVSSAGVVDSLGLLDLATGRLSPELLSNVGLRADQLPELVPVGEVAGAVSSEGAAATGLAVGTPVVASVGDGQAAGLGADAFRPGRAFLSLGTGLALGVASDVYEVSRAFRTLAGPEPGSYVFEGLLSSGAASITWLRDLFDVASERLDEHSLTRLAETVPAGADGLLMVPYLMSAETPYWDPAARGLLAGLRANHGPGHIVRATLEGVAHETRLLLDGIDAHLGRPVTEIVATGGGARNDVWVQVFADVTGRPVVRCGRAEVSALGAAVHAARAAGLGPRASLTATATRMSATGARFEPDLARHAAYDFAHATYRQLYPSLAKLFASWPDA